MRVEDDLRAALSSLERHAPDPATVLRAARGRAAGQRGSALPRWITALAAAASVIAVVAASLVITSAAHHRLAGSAAASGRAEGGGQDPAVLPHLCRRPGRPAASRESLNGHGRGASDDLAA